MIIKINHKSFECSPNGCGTVFTAPKEYNDNYTESQTVSGIPDGIIKEANNCIILYCPKCNKEAYRVSK